MTLRINYVETPPVKRPIESIVVPRAGLPDMKVWLKPHNGTMLVGRHDSYSSSNILTKYEAKELIEAITLAIGELDGN